MQWKLEKFKEDMSIIAFCPNCNYHYHIGVSIKEGRFYCYCPMCGEYLFSVFNDKDVIWNKRSIIDLMQEEMELDGVSGE